MNDQGNRVEMRPLTIPVHLELRSESVVLNQPEMAELLTTAELIAVGDCGCRAAKQACDAPLEVCLGLNQEARDNIDRNGWRSISATEALGLLEATHRAGLVHIAYRNDDGNIHLVCSCCTCCCGFLTSIAPRRYQDALITSTYVAEHDPEKCIDCGECVSRCPFGALARSADGSPVTFDAAECFGCGLCVSTCPTNAIVFVERHQGV
jgi:NAD-dependent dihydropyrimidine dehydrogenase PreA subunit